MGSDSERQQQAAILREEDALIAKWIDLLEQEMFPHQESEDEQESFTDIGRERVAEVFREFIREAQQKAATTELSSDAQSAPAQGAAPASSSSRVEAAKEDVYYVWVDRPLHAPVKHTKPRHRHPTLEHATTEARRLRDKLREKVIVMKVELELLP